MRLINLIYIIYLNNTLIYNYKVKKYKYYIYIILIKLQKYKLYINLAKYIFRIIIIPFLNFIITLNSLKIKRNQIKAVTV